MTEMRKDLRLATFLVADGLTFQEAANAYGLTRNSVAGACHRSGVKTGGYARWRGTQRASDNARHAVCVRWDGTTERQKAHHMAKVHAGRDRYNKLMLAP